ncbi:unnamed protein product [Meganyctiphanes norvegica]|uniref:Serine/threonine-protein kinase mTOR domain-containing protein n=1 Tax=Meganyctiphanes norvegica TaxID=48144 RepID=A0AAV2R4P9_MEGNR
MYLQIWRTLVLLQIKLERAQQVKFSTSTEVFFKTAVVYANLQAVTFIFKSLGVKGVPYFARYSFTFICDSSDASFRDYLFQQLATLIGIVKQHIRNYLTDIIQVLKEFWVPGGKMETAITIISVVESIAVGSEFKI